MTVEKPNDVSESKNVVARLNDLRVRGDKQPISYIQLFRDALDLADEQFRRAIAAEAAVHAMKAAFGWRDISSAPKDGTRVFLFHNKKHGPGYRTIGQWRDYIQHNPDWRTDSDVKLNPTHWMPLPSPPNTAEAGTKSAARFAAPHNSGERDPSVMSDQGAAETSLHCPFCGKTRGADPVSEAYERAAKIVEAECERVLSKQRPTDDPFSIEDSINSSLRMMAVLLPEIASAIRNLKQGGEKNGSEENSTRDERSAS